MKEKQKIAFLAFILCASAALGGCVTSVGAGGGSSSGVFGSVGVSSDNIGDVMGQIFGSKTGVSDLSALEMSNGLKQALSVGTEQVVRQLGRNDGFNTDPQVRIPLPSSLQKVDRVLDRVGMNGLTQDLELRLNRAAEAATPKAKALFLDAISQMTFDDAREILTGPNDAATQFLRRTMGPGLAREMAPIVGHALADAGAIQAYDAALGQYARVPFVPDVKADLQGYVVDRALDGIFIYVAAEERAIRENPAKRTTALLKKVFSAVQ